MIKQVAVVPTAKGRIFVGLTVVTNRQTQRQIDTQTHTHTHTHTHRERERERERDRQRDAQTTPHVCINSQHLCTMQT